ncbi:MAG: peptide-methionine (S)-S-oxide reductase MsrA [Fimbriimonadales bacterium]
MKMEMAMIGVAAGAIALAAFGSAGPEKQVEVTKVGDKELVVAAGCFWCVEAIFEELRGVSKVVSGYSGGKVPNPTYEQVCAGITGHAEAVKIYYNPAEVSADDLLRIFFTTHDPTTLNRQGPDSGTQYRSAIFYSNDDEKARAQRIIEEIGETKIWGNPIVTTLEPLKEFYLAEEYHQNYYDAYENASELQRMRMNSGYCRAIIEPKVAKFRQMYRDKLKKK